MRNWKPVHARRVDCFQSIVLNLYGLTFIYISRVEHLRWRSIYILREKIVYHKSISSEMSSNQKSYANKNLLNAWKAVADNFARK